MYKVIKNFTDLKDSNHVYMIGDEFPRQGHKVNKSRIEELATSKNGLSIPLIQLVEDNDNDSEDNDDDSSNTVKDSENEVEE